MPQVLDAIHLLVAPAVMISACGLLCLALYNRLAVIVSRARGFLKERFDAFSNLSQLALDRQTGPDARLLRARLVGLNQQVDDILRRGRLIRNAIACLLVTVVCMLSCSLALGLSVLIQAQGVALGLFYLGVITMITAVLFALWEITLALQPVLLEQADEAQLEHWDDNELP